MDHVSRLGWAASSTFRVGDLYLGVRSNSAAADELLRHALGSSWVPGAEAPPNFSAWIELPGSSRTRARTTRLSMLFRSSGMVVRSRSPRRVVEGLASYMSTHGDGHDGLLLSVSAALVGHDVAVIVPNTLMASFDLLQPRLQRHGWTFVDSIVTAIDPETAELVVRPPVLTVDAAALRDLGDGSGREVPAVPPGRYPIARWVFVAHAGIPQPMSRANGVAAAMRTAVNGTLGAASTLRGLAKVFECTLPGPMVFGNADEAVDVVVRVVSDAAADARDARGGPVG